MELKIIKEEQNPLFNRKEIIASLSSDSSPKKQEVVDYLSKKYSVPLNALRVLNIKGAFGTKEFTIRAHIYPSNDERDKYEKLTKKEKESEKPKPAEAAPETKTENVSETKEKPAEVPVEEKPAEEKKEEKPVVETKEEPTPEEDKKEKEKSKEEKLNEKELQA